MRVCRRCRARCPQRKTASVAIGQRSLDKLADLAGSDGHSMQLRNRMPTAYPRSNQQTDDSDVIAVPKRCGMATRARPAGGRKHQRDAQVMRRLISRGHRLMQLLTQHACGH